MRWARCACLAEAHAVHGLLYARLAEGVALRVGEQALQRRAICIFSPRDHSVVAHVSMHHPCMLQASSGSSLLACCQRSRADQPPVITRWSSQGLDLLSCLQLVTHQG